MPWLSAKELMLSNYGSREGSWESPAQQEDQPVSPKGNQPWILIGRTDAKAEAPILCPPVLKNQLIGKDPDAGKDWGQKERGVTEDEMVGWHHRLSRHEFKHTLGSVEGQGSLANWSPWGHKELCLIIKDWAITNALPQKLDILSNVSSYVLNLPPPRKVFFFFFTHVSTYDLGQLF